MENELLHQILANQVLLFKRIEDIEYAIKKSGFRSAYMKTYYNEMLDKTKELITHIKSRN